MSELTPSEVAPMFGYASTTEISYACRAGLLPATQYGRRWYIDAEVEEFPREHIRQFRANVVALRNGGVPYFPGTYADWMRRCQLGWRLPKTPLVPETMESDGDALARIERKFDAVLAALGVSV